MNERCDSAQIPLSTPAEVIHCLITFADWWQPSTSSFMAIGGCKRKDRSDGLHPGLVNTLELRSELCRRMELLSDKDRELLFLWYVRQLHVDDIASITRISRRQCFRRKSSAVRYLVDAGANNERTPSFA